MKYFTSFDGTKIAYDMDQRKSDTVLVFLHGAGGGLHAWDKEREYLSKQGFSTCAMDLRGHGESERPNKESQYHLRCFAKDLKQLLEIEKIRNCILIGHCFGGMITILFSKMFPKLGKSYILIDTTYKAPEQLHKLFHKHPLITRLINYRLEKVRVDKNFKGFTDYKKYIGTGDIDIRRIAEDVSHTTFKSWLFIYENIAEFDGRSALKSLKKPVLIIEGSSDKIFNTKIASEIHNLVKKSDFVILPDANHVLVINNDKQLSNIIHNFITEKKLA